jgi:hypothetical protein
VSAGEKAQSGPAGGIARRWGHFLVAAGILSSAFIGWNWVIATLQWVTRKEAVPWPAAVRVNGQFRLESFPPALGPFSLAQDGEFYGRLDGDPDGEVVPKEDELDSLKIGTALDKMRVGERKSNWYLARIYRDSRVRSPSDPCRFWRLEIFYYTGGLDKVPHVPERCLVASGATLVPSLSGEVSFEVDGQGPWKGPLPFRRTGYEVSDRLRLNAKQYVQYYTFSLNGRPEDLWEKVRLKLNDPRLRYCYFAKIQFAPVGEVTDIGRMDQAAQEFVSNIMPAALSMLPRVEDVSRLSSGGAASQ